MQENDSEKWPNVGFIGSGRMASAMVMGMAAKKLLPPKQILLCSKNFNSAKELAEKTGATPMATAAEVAQKAEIIVLAMKPHQLEEVSEGIQKATSGKIIVSVLAKTDLQKLQDTFPEAENIIRALPNIPSRIQEGMTPYSLLKPFSADERNWAEWLLTPLGETLELRDEQIPAATVLSSCSPAFIAAFAKGLLEAGEKLGINPEETEALVYQSLMGTSKLLKNRHFTPESLCAEVVSPGGPTEAGLECLSQGGFSEIIEKSVLNASKKS